MDMIPRLGAAIQSPLKITWTEDSLPSIFVCTGGYIFGLLLYHATRRNTRDGEEHGSAVWGSPWEVNRQFSQRENKILTRHVRLGLDSTKHRRSLNVLVIGGSGAAKTRSYVLPNILEANTNYVITDPKSEVLLTPDEVRKLHNSHCLLFIRGAKPVMDLKYDLMKHPAIHNSSIGGGIPYIHHQPPVSLGQPFFIPADQTRKE